MGLDEETSRIPARIKKSIATPQGKGVAAGLILVILVLIVLLLITFAFPKADNTSGNIAGGNTTTTTTVPVKANNPIAPSSSQSTETATSRTDTDTPIKRIDKFHYRDPFKPQVFIAAEINGNTTNTTIVNQAAEQGKTATGDPAQTNNTKIPLSLKRIAEQNGLRQAVIAYQGKDYTVVKDDRVGDSAYLVTEISENSVTLLYGDERLTIQVGNEVIK